MQLLMHNVHPGDVPPCLKSLLVGMTDANRTGLRSTATAQSRRTTRDPPLLNSLRSTWNTLDAGQCLIDSREQLKNELRDLALATYETECDRADCWNCQQLANRHQNSIPRPHKHTNKHQTHLHSLHLSLFHPSLPFTSPNVLRTLYIIHY